MIDLVILNVYGTIVESGNNATLVESGNDATLRNGFLKFIDKYQDKKIVLATDDELRGIVNRKSLGDLVIDYKFDLRDLKKIYKLDKVYTYQDMVEIKGYCGKRKDLKRICADLGVASKKAVFISDGEKDLEDAQRDKVKFVHVPYYKQFDEIFSFLMIDLSKRLSHYLDLRNANYRMRVFEDNRMSGF